MKPQYVGWYVQRQSIEAFQSKFQSKHQSSPPACNTGLRRVKNFNTLGNVGKKTIRRTPPIQTYGANSKLLHQPAHFKIYEVGAAAVLRNPYSPFQNILENLGHKFP